ncbi:MAG: hypothetical protein Q9P01_11015 [Anaerolineae bacterium]|nr:hypothetical protein [Anaerolineae bacterium]MDQ7035335.1 hypothetical protein [Anaerolineae bacterium]
MPIQHRQAVTWQGHPGTVTTTIKLIPRDDPSWSEPPGEGSFANDLASDVAGETFENPYTGEDVFVSYQEVADAHPEMDLQNSFLSIYWEFVLASGSRLYPSDMADEMRQNGWTEEKVQELLEWEQSIRANNTDE